MASFNAKVVFVNPFYKEGVGRRTGIELKKDVRKDSDGFENFDDYWSESENDATLNATSLAEKENLQLAANQKSAKQQLARKKSSLAPMPAFSPQVTSSEREESHVQQPEQNVSMANVNETVNASVNASVNDADITGSVIKGPSSSLEPSSAVCKFKTRQRLSFSGKTSDETSEEEEAEEKMEEEEEEEGTTTTTEEDGQSADYEASQESGASSSDGTVKAHSSQSGQSSQASETDQEMGSEGEKETAQDPHIKGESTIKKNRKSVVESGLSSMVEIVSSTHDAEESRPRRGKRPSLKASALMEQSHEASFRGTGAKEVKKPPIQDKKDGEAGQRRKSKRQSVRGRQTQDIEADGKREEPNQELQQHQEKLEGRRKSSQVESKSEKQKVAREEEPTKRRSRAGRKSRGVQDVSTVSVCEEKNELPQEASVKETEPENKNGAKTVTEKKKRGKSNAKEVLKSIEMENKVKACEDKTQEISEKASDHAPDDASDNEVMFNKVKRPDDQEDETENMEDDHFFMSLKPTKKVPSHIELNLEDEDDGLQICDVDTQEWNTAGEVETVNERNRVLKKESEKEENKQKTKPEKRKSVKGKAKEADTTRQKEDDTSVHKVKETESEDTGSEDGKSRKGKNKGGKRMSAISDVNQEEQTKKRTSSEAESAEERDINKSKGSRKPKKQKTSQSSSDADGSQGDISGHTEELEKPKQKSKTSGQGIKSRRKSKARGKRNLREKEKVTDSSGTEENPDGGHSGDDAAIEVIQQEAESDMSVQITRSDASVALSRRRSSVHFTTKDMISPEGDISIHRVDSSEEEERVHQRMPTTPAVASSHKGRRRKGSRPAHWGGHEKSDDLRRLVLKGSEGRDEGKGQEDESIEEEVGQSGRRANKKQRKTKPSRKSKSSESASQSSSAEDNDRPSVSKKQKGSSSSENRSSSSLESQPSSASSDESSAMADQGDKLVMEFLDQYENGATFNGSSSGRGATPRAKIPELESLMASSGSILKTSKNWQKKPKGRGKKYSLLYTEKPSSKAYIIPPEMEPEDGVRRTRRQRIRPLEYWRNERPIYERRKSGGFALSGVLSPEPVEEKRREKSRAGGNASKLKGRLPGTPSNISIHESPPHGTLPVSHTSIAVVNPENDQEVSIDAVATSKMLRYIGPSGQAAKPEDPITISKAFSQRAFSAGVLTVRPLEEKGSQLVRRDTMVFYVVRGKVAITLHQTTHILQNGDWFFVPKGNVYNIKNLRRDEAKLTFFQLKGA